MQNWTLIPLSPQQGRPDDESHPVFMCNGAQSKLRNPFTVVRAPPARCKAGSCNYGIYIITLPPNERKGYIFKCR